MGSNRLNRLKTNQDLIDRAISLFPESEFVNSCFQFWLERDFLTPKQVIALKRMCNSVKACYLPPLPTSYTPEPFTKADRDKLTKHLSERK